MLVISFALLSLAVTLGCLLLTGRARRTAILHGVLGGAGLAALMLAVQSGRLQGQFAWVTGGLLTAALFGGVSLAVIGRLGLVVFLHAMAGGVGYLLLAGLVLK